MESYKVRYERDTSFEAVPGLRISTTRSGAPSIPRDEIFAGSQTTRRSGCTTPVSRKTSVGAWKRAHSPPPPLRLASPRAAPSARTSATEAAWWLVDGAGARALLAAAGRGRPRCVPVSVYHSRQTGSSRLCSSPEVARAHSNPSLAGCRGATGQGLAHPDSASVRASRWSRTTGVRT